MAFSRIFLRRVALQAACLCGLAGTAAVLTASWHPKAPPFAGPVRAREVTIAALANWPDVLWVDADAIFLDISQDVTDLVRPDKDLYLVEHLWIDCGLHTLIGENRFYLRAEEESSALFSVEERTHAEAITG